MKIKISQDLDTTYLRIDGKHKLNTLIEMGKAKAIKAKVKDPLLRDIDAEYLILNDGKRAIIKLGSASGLTLLKPKEQNPLLTTSYGTGQLILNALDNGCREFIIGLADNSTIDCGMGMLNALGIKFFDINNLPIELNGTGLRKLGSFDMSELDPRIKESKLTIVSSSEKEFCGMSGSAYVEGPSIGATKLMVQALERGLGNFAYVVRNQLGIDLEDICGAGTSGGIAGSIIVFLKGKLHNEVEILI